MTFSVLSPIELEVIRNAVAGVALANGDCIRLETAGGGGFGDPDERDEELIASDREQGYVS